jgi:hypothetical protein
MNKIKLLSVWQLIYFVSILSLVFFKNNTFLDFVKIYVYVEVVCAAIIGVFIAGIVINYESSLKHL